MKVSSTLKYSEYQKILSLDEISFVRRRHILGLSFILRDKKFQFFHLFKVSQFTVEIWEFIQRRPSKYFQISIYLSVHVNIYDNYWTFHLCYNEQIVAESSIIRYTIQKFRIRIYGIVWNSYSSSPTCVYCSLIFPLFFLDSTPFFHARGLLLAQLSFRIIFFFLPLSKLTNEIDYCIQDSGRRRSQDGNRRDGDSSVIVEKRPRLPSHVSAIISVLRERCNSLSPFWTTSCCLVASSRSSLEYEKPSKPSRFEQRSKNTRGEIIEDDEGRNYRRRRGKKLSKNKKNKSGAREERSVPMKNIEITIVFLSMNELLTTTTFSKVCLSSPRRAGSARCSFL